MLSNNQNLPAMHFKQQVVKKLDYNYSFGAIVLQNSVMPSVINFFSNNKAVKIVATANGNAVAKQVKSNPLKGKKAACFTGFNKGDF